MWALPLFIRPASEVTGPSAVAGPLDRLGLIALNESNACRA